MNWDGLQEVGAEVKGIRTEECRIQGQKLRHATFIRVHVKQGEFRNLDFSHSRFIDCYFRHTEFRDCNFTGAVFTACDLPHAKFIECSLPYSRWHNTRVDMVQLLPNLPYDWPQVAHDLCQNLRVNFRAQGDGPAARRLLFHAMAFHRSTLWETVLVRKSWYKERYRLVQRFRAAIRLVGSWVERLGWGYGESPGLLLLWAAVSILLFGNYYHILGFADSQVINGGFFEQIGKAIEFSALSFVGSTERSSWPEGPTAAIAIQGTLGILFIGVFAAVVYKWISMRQG